jgi:MFS family permease
VEIQADHRFRWLLWLSFSEIGTMLVFANYSALLPVLQKEWSLTNSQAGWIYSSYQIGYILSVVFFSSLTDYTSPKYIYVITSFWAGVSGIFFSIWADGLYSALLLRTLMGIGFAGTYMPGLRMVSEKFASQERGRAVGFYVAAFTLGAAVSFFATGFLNTLFSWRLAFFLTSLGPIAGGAIALLQLGEIKTVRRGEVEEVAVKAILFNRPALLMIGGYVAHMWEMFGMRGWLVAFLTACLVTNQVEFTRAVSLASLIAGFVTLVGAASSLF